MHSVDNDDGCGEQLEDGSKRDDRCYDHVGGDAVMMTM